MRRASMLVAACAVLGALVASSSASAAYNAPREAKKISLSMVTAYNQCTAPTLTHRPPLANSACPPAQSSANNAANVYTFDRFRDARRGSASVTLQTARGDVKLAAKSTSIMKDGTLYSGTGLTGTANLRTTDNGCGASPHDVDCTIVDFPFPVGLTCVQGSCKSIEPTANGVLPNSVHEDDKSSIDIGQISILDEDGDAFVRGGLFVARSYRSPAFNAPKSAIRIAPSMVPAHNQCTAPTVTHRPTLAFPACPPVQSSANNPANTYTFGQTASGADDGYARVTLTRAPRDVRIYATSRSIQKNGTLYSGNDLVMTAIIRDTDDDCGVSPFNVDCTQVDFPFPMGLSCTSGSCKSVSPSWNAFVPEAIHREDKSNIEIGQISILDEEGDAVARSGLFVK